MRITILTVATPDYLPGARALFYSLLQNNYFSSNVELVCLVTGVRSDEILEGMGVKLLQLATTNHNIKSSTDVGRFANTLLKFQVFRFFEESTSDRIIFFDADMLCLGEIEELSSSKYNSHNFWAVRDYACSKYYRKSLKTYDLMAKKVFNTGMFLANRNLLNELSYDSLIEQTASKIFSYDGGDQGYLNQYFKKNEIENKFLHPKFNYATDRNWPLTIHLPKMLHYTGPKPWIAPRFEIFYETPFYNYFEIVSSSAKLPHVSFQKINANYFGGARKDELKKIWLRREFHILFFRFKDWKFTQSIFILSSGLDRLGKVLLTRIKFAAKLILNLIMKVIKRGLI
ncbi:MAG: glycosyltransferase [Bacteroidota bacterium]